MRITDYAGDAGGSERCLRGMALVAPLLLTLVLVGCGERVTSKDEGGVGHSSPPEAALPSPEPPPATGFLKRYTNPAQAKLPADSIYPMGQRMWLSAYSTFGRHYTDVRDAGMTMNGPYYHGGMTDPNNWKNADAHGMKGIYHLRLPNTASGNGWKAVLPRMKTADGRKFMTDYITGMINRVQANPKLDNHIVAWYGSPEEPMPRDTMTMAEQRAALKFIHKVVASVDKKKRPVYHSERGDSAYYLMIGNQRDMQDGSLKQNYLVKGNAYNGGDTHERMVMWRWAKDVVDTARDADAKWPSYTGRPRAAITTLSAYIDPSDPAEQNEAWLRKIITYDIYVSLYEGVDGITVYAYNDSSTHPSKTKRIQRKIYTELLGHIQRSGLGQVFLWGDDRDDLSMEIVRGPKEITWKKYSSEYTAPSLFMRNIQYGEARYVLMVNNSKEDIEARVAGFPTDEDKMKILDMPADEWSELGASITPAIQPLGVRMYKIVRK